MWKDELYIANYCDKRCTPFASITSLPTEEAYAIAKKLSQHTGTSFTSFSRFSEKDFDGYYKKRIRTEEWLYNSFVALGGKPKTTHPLYFVLGESRYLEDWFEKGSTTKILLSDINPYDISFTFGDSMSMMDAEDRKNPFTKDSLVHFIHETTNDVGSYLNELNKQNRYIEVQLWNDSYVKSLC